ncbi:MAG: hypothetical protein II344_00535 [Bacteroidales bacterium]|nr:hypothetical protein [Bacteroidales bacterium]
MKHILFLCLVALFLVESDVYAGDVVYGKNSRLKKEQLAVPYFQKKPNASITGKNFMLQADKMKFWELEDFIVNTVLQGNMPEELKQFRKIVFKTPVVDSVEVLRKPHTVEIWVLPDYISIGTSDDFVRMPMGPLAAQRIADSLDCILPTTFLVDRIAEVSQGHLEIFPFRPLGDRNCKPIVFQDSNNAINALYKAYGYKFGQFISGLKKDVVITYKIQTLKGNENRVAIYGWHHPNGKITQPLYVRHVNFYVDYSHGIRLIYHKIKVDGKEMDARQVLESPALYRLLSNEPMHLQKASY